MDIAEVSKALLPLWDDITAATDGYPAVKPLLAHYTSIDIAERILRSGEVWLSNPLLMNDDEEVRLVLLEGYPRIGESELVAQALGAGARADLFREGFSECFEEFATVQVFDTYVLCLSVHQHENIDGILSMWRGYGGNGRGAALVFDTATIESTEGSPLIVDKVRYLDREARLTWVNDLARKAADLISAAQIPDNMIGVAAHLIFQRLKIFALYTKHPGFREEDEWRVAYVRNIDVQNLLEPMFSYHVGRHGIEPKLKLKLTHIEGVTAPNFSLDTAVDRIILGPSVSSPLAKQAFCRMLMQIGKGELCGRVHASSIPFRPTSG